jgi:hypothetical protein
MILVANGEVVVAWDERSHPPLSATAEEVAVNDGRFEAECLGAVEDIRRDGVTFGELTVTAHPYWGLIMRVDLLQPGERASAGPDRLVCWRLPTGELVTLFASGPDL